MIGVSSHSSRYYRASLYMLMLLLCFLATIGGGCIITSQGSLAESPSVEVYFSPNGGCADIIRDRIDDADSSVLVAVYSLTSLDLSRSLVNAKKRGVDVRIITDNLQAEGRYSKSQYLLDNGVTVQYDDDNGYMHHKFAVIDNKILFTGSYNWSNSAETRNDENLLQINDKELADFFSREFDRLWREYGE